MDGWMDDGALDISSLYGGTRTRSCERAIAERSWANGEHTMEAGRGVLCPSVCVTTVARFFHPARELYRFTFCGSLSTGRRHIFPSHV